ncbi:hypothetical protein M885DRAFT_544608 [Pelagophyceae sp. CCMP2097]|nr:hypothetical protein M885DRAFT_544608 [Pelagophyceae sp. CCMP2097]
MFSIVSVFVKVAAQELHSLEVAWLASVVRWAGLVVALKIDGASPMPRPEVRALVGGRCFFGALGFGCATYAFGALPLGDASSILFSSPAWATVMAFFVLGEKIDAVGVGAILASIGGVVLVSRPSFLFGHADGASGGGGASLVTLLGSLSAAATMLLIRVIGKRGGEHPAVMSHASALFNVLVAPVALVIFPNAFLSITGPKRFSLFPTALCCFGAGAFGIGNQYLSNWGTQKAPVGLCSMMRNMDVVFSFIWQILFFRAVPNLSSVAGAAVIVFCSGVTALRQYRKAKKTPAKAVELKPAQAT